MSLAGFLSAVQLSLRDPDAAVASLRALRLTPAEVVAAATAITAISTLLGWPVLAATPVEEGTVWALFARHPLVFAASQLLASLFGAALMTWAGRAFGGRAGFSDCLLALVWVQVILTALEAVQAVLMLVFPPVAGILSLLGFALFFYLVVRFATALHGFRNPALVLVGMVGTLVLTGLVLSIAAGALGLLPEPAP